MGAIWTNIKGEKFKVMFCKEYITFFCPKDKSFLTIDHNISMKKLLKLPYFNLVRQIMWVDKYGFEIFMGDQEERKEGDRWVPDETSEPEKQVTEDKPKNTGLF